MKRSKKPAGVYLELDWDEYDNKYKRKSQMKHYNRLLILLFLTLYYPCNGQPNWTHDATVIGKSAYAYRILPGILGGGEGSYVGYTLPHEYSMQRYYTYTIYELFPEQIVLLLNIPRYKVQLFIEIDSTGNFRAATSGSDYMLDRIGRLAYQYRNGSAAEGGGEGSYIGFKIPITYQTTSFGSYAISTVQKDEIVIIGRDTTDGKIIRAQYLANGKRYRMGDYYNEVKAIEAIASQYRKRPFSQRGGQGSYVGFKIPQELESTPYGKYMLYDVQPEELVIKVFPRTIPFSYLYVIDSMGREKVGGLQRNGNFELFNKNVRAIINDMELICQDAARYWIKTSLGMDIPGSFDGFMIPDTLANTSDASYSLAEVQDDTLYIRVVSSKGYGTEYFRVDANGKQHLLVFGEYRPPKVLPKNTIMKDTQAKYKLADAKLNEIYKQLLKKRKSDSKFIENLLTAERLWIKYRDAQVAEKYPLKTIGSNKTMLTRSQLYYLKIITEKRIKELQELLELSEKGVHIK